MNKNSIKSTLNNYLKQKNYPINERFRKSDLVLTQSKEEFLMDLKINTEISRTNSFTFSNISSLNGSQSLVDQQVSRLVKFVQCQRNSTLRKELESLLPPIVCHLYIEMLKGREWRPAHDFLRKFSCLVGNVQEISQQKVNGSDPNLLVVPQTIHFLPQSSSSQNSSLHQNIYNRITPSTSKHQAPHINQLNLDEQKLLMFRELITNLSYLKRLEDVKDNKLIINFRSCKYKVKISNKTLSVLNKYLSKHSHVLLIQILHLWFNMDLYDLHDEFNDDSSSSSSSSSQSDLLHQQNNYDTNRNSSSKSNIDRYTDPSYCDTLDKDIKFNVNSGLQYEKSALNRCDDNSMDNLYGSSSNSSNIKIKRLRECLHRVDSKYHKPIRIFNINYTDNSLCSASTDKQLCHLAAGFEDSSILLWSINGFENYGHKPFQSFDDRLCQWSINNCNRMLTDDLSDYESSDEEVEKNIKSTGGAEDGESTDESSTTMNALTKLTKRRRNSNKYRKTLSIKEQWKDYTSKNSCENNFSIDSQSIILRGHRSSVTDLVFGRNNTLLSVSRDKTFRLWKADSYTCASVYRGHEYPIWCVDESSNGCYAATGSRDTTARLWSYERKFPVRVYAGHTLDVDCIAFHPNGNYFATGSADTNIRMWCVTSGRLLRIFTECHLPVNTISFSPDGKFLAAAGDETKIRVFDLAAGQQLLDLKNHTASVKSLSWSSNSKKLLSGCSDGSFYVWNINTPATNTSNISSSTNAKDSSSSSSSSSTLIQSNSTGCKRIVKVFFSGPDEIVHAIGND
ncbi:transcription initiation factor TFIID subunit 5 isoform X1 [Chironomus tepperi]|uniref:transcription initiation factor TFIID subunit 5 isoform X1 n=2 Tax=Chironomus tepperi TaxID=113505 RepID=UPI00391EF5F5